MSTATHPFLQPLQDQVDALTTILQSVSNSAASLYLSARAVGATTVALLTASATTAVLDPASRANTQLVITNLLLKTNAAPVAPAISTVITLTATVGSNTTIILTKTIVLAALAAVGNVVDILGLNGNTAAAYIPVGAIIKATASTGNFDFVVGLAVVAPAPAS